VSILKFDVTLESLADGNPEVAAVLKQLREILSEFSEVDLARMVARLTGKADGAGNAMIITPLTGPELRQQLTECYPMHGNGRAPISIDQKRAVNHLTQTAGAILRLVAKRPAPATA
jgi:hypothetical protein